MLITLEIKYGPQAGVRGERALGRAFTDGGITLGDGFGAEGEGSAGITA
jgi:hypothetical protein